MTTWRLFARGAMARPFFADVELSDDLSATAARSVLTLWCENHPARPSLYGVRLAAGGPWLNAGQLRGRESAAIVYAIHAVAIVRRPDWLLSCPQDGQYRPWGAPCEAASLPLPIASRGRTRAHVRHAAEVGQRWAKAGR